MAAGVLGEDLRKAVSDSKTLVVGAGGIGCELIKNLVLSGFQDLVIVDLDTIDVSNLNRQFLFQKHHVGRPKVEVAKESALLFNPRASIRAIHDSILNEEYNVSFFKQFSIVLNALDNKKARNHVNRMCLAAGVSLVESGSAGYLGQVTVIRKGESECYECQPKPAAKTFPGCTIRNTPSEPIHCVVWAKHLYNQLFGEADADNDVSPETALISSNESNDNNDDDNGSSDNDSDMEVNEVSFNGHKKDVSVAQTSGDLPVKDMNIDKDSVTATLSTRAWAEKNDYSPKMLLNKLFVSDIKYLLTMDKLWKTRAPPTPLCVEDRLRDDLAEDEETSSLSLPDQRVWTSRECIETFIQCVPSLNQRRVDRGEMLIWDKDCSLDLDFVVSAANLRASVFDIPMKSKFTIKSMAGNIIPAIATTNAVISGLIVMEALKILGGEFNKCKTTYLPKLPNPYKRLLVTCPLMKPNPQCYVCSPRPEATVELNANTVTMATLRDKILIGHFGMVAPDVELDDGKGTILLSSEEGETDDNLPRVLSEFGVGNSSRLKVDDFLQNYQLIINLIHSDSSFEDEKEFAVVSQDSSELPASKKSTDDENGRSVRKRKASVTDDEVVASHLASKRLRTEERVSINDTVEV